MFRAFGLSCLTICKRIQELSVCLRMQLSYNVPKCAVFCCCCCNFSMKTECAGIFGLINRPLRLCQNVFVCIGQSKSQIATRLHIFRSFVLYTHEHMNIWNSTKYKKETYTLIPLLMYVRSTRSVKERKKEKRSHYPSKTIRTHDNAVYKLIVTGRKML